jgi:hypothetical protein
MMCYGAVPSLRGRLGSRMIFDIGQSHVVCRQYPGSSANLRLVDTGGLITKTVYALSGEFTMPW